MHGLTYNRYSSVHVHQRLQLLFQYHCQYMYQMPVLYKYHSYLSLYIQITHYLHFFAAVSEHQDRWMYKYDIQHCIMFSYTLHTSYHILPDTFSSQS